MAQYVMQHIVSKAGLTSQFEIDSAATSNEEIGNLPHRGTQRVLTAHGIPCGDHRARRLTRADAQRWDYIVCMDRANVRSTTHFLGAGAQGKISRLMEYTGSVDDVADPWYTGDFDTCYNDVLAGCEGLLRHITADK